MGNGMHERSIPIENVRHRRADEEAMQGKNAEHRIGPGPRRTCVFQHSGAIINDGSDRLVSMMLKNLVCIFFGCISLEIQLLDSG